MSITIDGKKITPDIGFTLYFSLMACFYSKTYIQLFAQIFILGYVCFTSKDRLFGLVLNQRKISNLLFYSFWFALFTVLMFVSTRWASTFYNHHIILLRTFRICVIGFPIFYFADSKEKAYSLLFSLLIGCFCMAVLATLTSPVDSWFKAGINDVSFGYRIAQHRNQIGAMCAVMTFASYYFTKFCSFNLGQLFTLVFAFVLVISGSRAALLQLGLIFGFWFFVMQKDVKTKVNGFLLLLVFAGITWFILMNNDYLYNQIGMRLEKLVFSTLGFGAADNSAKGRDYYKIFAMELFPNRKLLGYGVNGFVSQLTLDPYHFINFKLNPTYSHCNYTELLADFGLTGFFIWYIPVISTAWKVWKRKTVNFNFSFIASIFLSMILLDYARIPWETHLTMYLWFVVILLCRNLVFDYVEESTKNI